MTFFWKQNQQNLSYRLKGQINCTGQLYHCAFRTSDKFKKAEYNTNGISVDVKLNSNIGHTSFYPHEFTV